MKELEKIDKDAFKLLMEMYEEESRIDATEKIEHPEPALSLGFKTYETKDGLKEFPVPLGTYGNFKPRYPKPFPPPKRRSPRPSLHP